MRKGTASFAAGPIQVGFQGFVGLRLNEHALHAWDIDVALDAATILSSIAALVVDNLELIGRYTAKPTPGEPRSVTVRTTDPQRRFTVDFTAEGATLTPSDDTTGEGDLEMPAEAFVRLVYGRLDPARRIDVVAGRGSSDITFPLFDLDARNYDLLYRSKLELLLALNGQDRVRWSGPHRRQPLVDAVVVPRPRAAECWLVDGRAPVTQHA